MNKSISGPVSIKSCTTLCIATACGLLLLGCTANLANAQTFTSLYSFSNTSNTLGNNPYGSLAVSGTTLYGLTLHGGTAGIGTVFSVGSDGSAYQTLYTFSSGTTGNSPYGSLTLSGSTMYGMTDFGGTGDGNVFSIGTNGTGYQNLLTFSGTNGQSPQGNNITISSNGTTLYGMTVNGGTSGDGNIFSIGTNGSGYQNLYSFTGGTNGEFPFGSLTQSGTTLYGMARNGGPGNAGTIFSIGVDGTGYQSMFAFTGGTNGNQPYGNLTLVGTTFYGMTVGGGTGGQGNVFSIGMTGSGYQNLISFSGSSGQAPYGSLTVSGTTLYGMTESGGTNSDGTLFSIGLDGSSFKSLLSFSGTPNGANPYYEGFAMSGSTLFGTTVAGGVNNLGTVFEVTVPAPEPGTLTLLAVGAVALYLLRRRAKLAYTIVPDIRRPSCIQREP